MQQSGEDQRVRPPVPPFDEETAEQKVRAAQDTWKIIMSERRYRWESSGGDERA